MRHSILPQLFSRKGGAFPRPGDKIANRAALLQAIPALLHLFGHLATRARKEIIRSATELINVPSDYYMVFFIYF